MGKKRMAFCTISLMLIFLLAGCGLQAEKNGTVTESADAEGKQEVSEVLPVSEEENSQAETDTETDTEIDTDTETDTETETDTKISAEAAVPAQQLETAQPFAGKKVTICGDSISTFTGYIPEYYSKYYPENGSILNVEETWWMQVLERTGMELCRNASFSGSTVSGQSQDNHEGRYSCGNQRMADLASEDGSSPDVIIILMGANDLLNDIPLGNYDIKSGSAVPEGNIQTFSEAYALMLDKMKTWYPDAEIYCCTVAEVSRQNEAGEKFSFMNAHGLTAKEYNTWITAIAESRNIPVIDVYQCGITFDNAAEYTSDGTHPNPAGAALIAEKVCEAFQ